MKARFYYRIRIDGDWSPMRDIQPVAESRYRSDAVPDEFFRANQAAEHRVQSVAEEHNHSIEMEVFARHGGVGSKVTKLSHQRYTPGHAPVYQDGWKTVGGVS